MGRKERQMKKQVVAQPIHTVALKNQPAIIKSTPVLNTVAFGEPRKFEQVEPVVQTDFSDMRFNDAFEYARKNGLNTFTWKGNNFNTNLAENKPVETKFVASTPTYTPFIVDGEDYYSAMKDGGVYSQLLYQPEGMYTIDWDDIGAWTEQTAQERKASREDEQRRMEIRRRNVERERFGNPTAEGIDSVLVNSASTQYQIKPIPEGPSQYTSEEDYQPASWGVDDNGKYHQNEKRAMIIHHTGRTGPIAELVARGALSGKRWKGGSKGTGAHVVIDRDGNRTVLSPVDMSPGHAGTAAMSVDGKIRSRPNDYAIGVELVGNTNEEPFTEAQLQSLIEYAHPIIQQYNIPFEQIVTHQEATDLFDEIRRPQALEVGSRKIDIDPKQMDIIRQMLLEQVYEPIS